MILSFQPTIAFIAKSSSRSIQPQCYVTLHSHPFSTYYIARALFNAWYVLSMLFRETDRETWEIQNNFAFCKDFLVCFAHTLHTHTKKNVDVKRRLIQFQSITMENEAVSVSFLSWSINYWIMHNLKTRKTLLGVLWKNTKTDNLLHFKPWNLPINKTRKY